MINSIRSGLTAVAFALSVPVVVGGCTGGSGSAAVSATAAKEAAGIAKRVQARPADADKILAEAGTDRAAFEGLLYDIAQDADASRIYADAMK